MKVVVVDNGGQVIEARTIRALDHLILFSRPVEMHFPANQIVDGVIEVRINYSGDDDMIMWQQAETALENQFGVNFLGFAFDHVMYCLPDLPGGWVAYGYIDYFRTVYNNEWCTYLSTQVVSIICRSNYTCYH